MKKNILSLAVLTLLVLSGPLSAQISPTISVQGTNATLRWASMPGESFIVLYRRAFHQDFPWIIIATNLPASDEAETVFQHIGGVPLVPAEVGGGGGGGGGGGSSPPQVQSAIAPGTETDDKVKKKDNELPAFPSLPDEKQIEKWLNELLKEYEKAQHGGGGGQTFSALMTSSLTAAQATSNSMGFYAVLEASADDNGDGVPNGWVIYYGFDPSEDQTTIDSDGDGATNAEEYNAGSHPLNPIGLPGVAASFLSERSATTNSLDGGMFYDEFLFEWGVGAWSTNRYVFLAPYTDPATSEIQTGTTMATVWPWQVAQLKPGTQTTWIDVQGGGKSTIVITTNIALPMGPYQSSWRNGVIDGITNISKVDFISVGTNSTLKRVYEVNFSGYSGTNSYTMLPITNFTGITIASQTLNTNGRAYVVFFDNSRTNVTPVLPGALSNAAYSVTIAAVNLALVFRNNGELTPREVNGAGFSAPLYDQLTNAWGSRVLGASLPPKLFTPAGQTNVNLTFRNQEETSAIVPLEATPSLWKWQQDAQGKVFRWRPDNPGALENFAAYEKTFEPASPPGTGNDNGAQGRDEQPDVDGLIIDADGPAFAISPNEVVPAGTLYLQRTYFHLWVTWNGGVAAEPIRWHSFITIRKRVDGLWEFVGKNEIELTASGDKEIPTVTGQEIQSLILP